MGTYANPLHESAVRFPMTQLWNDSCGKGDLEFALARGAAGATSNPVIVGGVLRKEPELWTDRLSAIIRDEAPSATDEEICWKLSTEMGVAAARMLEPMFRESAGARGRQALQVNPRFYRDAARTAAQAVELSLAAENILVKMPVSSSGVKALEEATYAGVSVNGTVSFGLPQAVAAAEAIERGLARREKEGLPVDRMSPSCTLMIGRADDWLKKCAERDAVPILPQHLERGGVAIFKKAYALFKERRYRAKLLAASNKSHHLWSNFIGADILITVNPVWWRKMEGCRMDIRRTIDDPVSPDAVAELYDKIEDFRKLYDEHGIAVGDFDSFGAFKDTMREFFGGYDDFLSYLRDMIMNS